MTEHDAPLDVLLHGSKIGQIRIDEKGYQLSYEPGRQLPHSLSRALRHQVSNDWSMPVHRYKGGAVWESSTSPLSNFLFGLLPDNPDVLSDMSRRYGVEDRNPVELLAHVGMDCVGAVQFSEQSPPTAPDRSALSLISDSEIEAALRIARERGIRYEGAALGAATNGRFRPGSLLAGFQPKFGLLRGEHGWLRSTPEWGTTHIFKSGVAGREGQAAFEFLGMRAAHHVGLKAAAVALVEFGDEHALVVERFDRKWLSANEPPARIHQEDLAQLLSVPVFPARKKYGRDAKLVLAALMSLEGGRDIAYTFIQQLAYNTLIGNADAHIKNYSVRYDSDTGAPLMTPLYDSATDAHDPQFHSVATLPVRIGGTVDYNAIMHSSMWWDNLSKSAGLDSARVMDDVRRLSLEVPEAIIAAADELPTSHRATVADSGVREAIAEICTNIENSLRTGLTSAPPSGVPRSEARAMRPAPKARPACGHLMPRSQAPCVAPAGHRGPHRSR